MTVTSTLYREYREEKDLKTNNLRELACKKKTNRQNKNIPDIRLYNSIFSNG